MLLPTLKNADLEQELNDNGFVVIPSFLSKEEVEKLLAIYKIHHIEREQGYWNSHNNLSIESGAQVSVEIKAVMEPHLDEIFRDWSFPYAQLIVKNPGQKHNCSVHRDDSIFDEQKVQYRQLWMPLVDLTTENGALYVIPQSHKLFTDSKPVFANWPYVNLIPALESEYLTLYAKAGDLIIWVEKTLHGSYENVSTETRPVFQGGVIHKDVNPLFNKYIPERNEVEVYEVDPHFFLNKEYLNPAVDAKYPLLRIEKYSISPITEVEVKEFFSNTKK